MGRLQDWLNDSPANKNKMLERMREYKASHPDEARDAPADNFLMTMLMNGYIDEDAPRLAGIISNTKKKEPEPDPIEEEPEIVLEEYPKKKYEVWTWVPERDDPDLNGKNKKGV